ncbi:PQQ-binding-like beta-propeller repeat protein [Actinoplanes sp. Pm04-4]|uniref:PQQ-binding-like beta-propeller repeat protein n=1 Tax=Paractinoplanes pyxinae TaxID=2997416 RepID=A0ABT4B6F5_9ACTN|nr:PQQ-binding-like beta-propeller repeat protein [Actinoplanes pyxinae]MCY1142079.1 PQQ-binding-like beta-propeller repeat protein [Actinoplanes pyxinae]
MLIDLDAAPEPSLSPARARRPVRYWIVAVLVLVLILVGGSAAPGRPGGIAEVLTVEGQGTVASLLTGEAFYLAHMNGTIEARPLCAGCPKWSTRGTPGQRLTMAEGDTLILDGNDTAESIFLDARTGALRWRLNNALAVDPYGGRVAAWSFEDRVLRMRDLRSGRALWSRPAFNYSADDAYVVIADKAGGATVYDAATGRERTPRRELGVPDPAVQLVGERVLLLGGSYLAAYHRDGLSREWITSTPAAYGVLPCGDGLLCVFGAEGLTVLDAADGSVRWADPAWTGMGADGVLTEEGGRTAIVDLATGRVERELGRTAPVGDSLLFPEPGRTTVVGLSDGRVRGVLPLVSPGACSAAGPFLACETPNVTFTVWRLPG